MSFSGIVTNLDLYVVLAQHSDLKDYNYLFDVLKSKSSVQLCESVEEHLKPWCRQFCYRLNTRWNKSRRLADKFRQQNSEWLNSEIQWPKSIKENFPCSQERTEVNEQVLPSTSEASTSTTEKTPRKSFEDISNRQKRRCVEEIVQTHSKDELLFAAQNALRSGGNEDMVTVMKYMVENPENVSKIMSVIQGKSTPVRQVLPEKALALYISMKLSKWRYITLRQFSLDEGLMYPSYHKLLKEKQCCYPRKEDMVVTETLVKINLQALLDLTVKRLVKSLNYNSSEELVLYTKWGLDGSSSQSVYHQKRENSGSEEDLSTVLMTSLVPLKLIEKTSGNTIWENDRPSSTSYCRPISFKFIKESEDSVKSEIAGLESEIKNVTPTNLQTNIVTHSLMMTMIDGKIHSIISKTSSATCDLCQSRPTEMNKLEDVRAKAVNTDMYQYGLSSLHAWIRSMECLLHISYKLDVKSWQAKGDEMKEKVKERKVAIQEAFRKETGLLLDVVKQGSGNTNTGNAARRFFSDVTTTARITGLDGGLIRRIAVILQCVSSFQKIHFEKFEKYCIETAKLYVELYPWYYMPSSLHKLLIHGPHIARNFSFIPIGFLSEEASEARNKDFRKYRSDHTRKHNAIATNEDILHNLLLSSDPLLTRIRPKMNKKPKKSLFEEVDELLISEQTEFEFVDVSAVPEEDSDCSANESDDEDMDDDLF